MFFCQHLACQPSQYGGYIREVDGSKHHIRLYCFGDVIFVSVGLSYYVILLVWPAQDNSVDTMESKQYNA